MQWSVRSAGFFLLVVLGSQLMPSTASASTSGVLCAGPNTTLVGESLREGSEGCIDVLDWSWGADSPSTIDLGGGGGAGKVAFESFSFSKLVDSSTEDFLSRVAQGSQFANLEFKEFRDCADCQQPAPYLTIEFGNVVVVSQQLSGTNGATPSEVVDLIFQTVKLCYQQTNQQGQLEQEQCFGWDVAANTQL